MAKSTRKTAAKKTAAAPKAKPAVKRRASPKARAPVMITDKKTRKALGEAVTRAMAGLRAAATEGETGWKANRHGFEEGAISCYSCAWYQPYTNPTQGGVLNIQAGASQIGYCRAESVPITNLNMAVYYDGKSGSFRTSGYLNPYVSNNETLTEVIIYDSTEFWCRLWVRTLNAFPWPPLYIEPPPVPNGGP